MKKLIITLLFSFVVKFLSYSQDILTFKNGTETKVKVTEVTSSEVKFKKFDNIDGPLYSILKSDLFMVKYENGTKEVFSTQTNAEGNPVETAAGPTDVGYDRLHFNGPRVGVTFIGDGSSKQRLEDEGYSPVISQFGWQFETRIFTTSTGVSGLVEWVLLVGGIEKGIFLPSASMLLGIRGKKGFEFGLGPNLSAVSFGMVLAAGTSFRSGKMIFPITLAVVPSVKNSWYSDTGEKEATGIRVSLLIGFNTMVR